MPKEELVEGIRQAISRGDSLEKAMMSFFNSGYAKHDIEEAAAAAQYPGISSGISPTGSAPAVPGQVTPGVVQRVSAYGEPKANASSSKIITILLIVTLIVLLGILASLMLFKDQIVSFFSGLFG